ncbi:MAG: hypothetical protein ACOXZW_03600 [Bacilli bacterium]|jgi:hypothetical protein|nr:hypothetical protein [Bacilli bacterium]
MKKIISSLFIILLLTGCGLFTKVKKEDITNHEIVPELYGLVETIEPELVISLPTKAKTKDFTDWQKISYGVADFMTDFLYGTGEVRFVEGNKIAKDDIDKRIKKIFGKDTAVQHKQYKETEKYASFHQFKYADNNLYENPLLDAPVIKEMFMNHEVVYHADKYQDKIDLYTARFYSLTVEEGPPYDIFYSDYSKKNIIWEGRKQFKNYNTNEEFDAEYTRVSQVRNEFIDDLKQNHNQHNLTKIKYTFTEISAGLYYWSAYEVLK